VHGTEECSESRQNKTMMARIAIRANAISAARSADVICDRAYTGNEVFHSEGGIGEFDPIGCAAITSPLPSTAREMCHIHMLWAHHNRCPAVRKIVHVRCAAGRGEITTKSRRRGLPTSSGGTGAACPAMRET
jgi:hypothetical protein